MSLQDRFLEYADAFEQVYETNNWQQLAQYFTDNASYDSGDGSVPAEGRPAVLAKLEGAVDGLDRLMDSRSLTFDPPGIDVDTVSVGWTVHYTKAGADDLQVHGTEFARFEGDRSAQLWDVFKPGAIEAVGEWMAAHGDKLSS